MNAPAPLGRHDGRHREVFPPRVHGEPNPLLADTSAGLLALWGERDRRYERRPALAAGAARAALLWRSREIGELIPGQPVGDLTIALAKFAQRHGVR